MIVDVHAHLDFEDFDKDREELMQQMQEAGVKAVVCNGVHPESNRKVIALAEKYPMIKVALGIYPAHCLELSEQIFNEEIHFIEEQIKHKKCIAIGEVGLDYFEDKEITDEKKASMKKCLLAFIMIAKKYNIPIIIHSRKAELETIELLEQADMKNKKVIMHCFCGKKSLIKRIKENKWSLSIPCMVLKTEQFQDMVKEVPLNQLVTETDSPLLAPVLGERNDPRNVALIIKKIAEIKQMEEIEVANIIYSNYQRLFL